MYIHCWLVLEKAYECNVCGKAFAESPKLTNHMKTHTGGKCKRSVHFTVSVMNIDKF